MEKGFKMLIQCFAGKRCTGQSGVRLLLNDTATTDSPSRDVFHSKDESTGAANAIKRIIIMCFFGPKQHSDSSEHSPQLEIYTILL